MKNDFLILLSITVYFGGKALSQHLLLSQDVICSIDNKIPSLSPLPQTNILDIHIQVILFKLGRM